MLDLVYADLAGDFGGEVAAAEEFAVEVEVGVSGAAVDGQAQSRVVHDLDGLAGAEVVGVLELRVEAHEGGEGGAFGGGDARGGLALADFDFVDPLLAGEFEEPAVVEFA